MGLRPNFIFKLLFVFAFAISAKAQNSALAKWTAKYDKTKAFIENKGQFQIDGSQDAVAFAMDHGSTKIYFTKKGLVFSFLNVWQKETNKEERDQQKVKGFASAEEFKEFEDEGRKVEYSTDVIPMNWVDANPAVQIVAEEETPDYHSYSFKENGLNKSVDHVKAYKKITYKNLYANIDVEYTFHPESGIKYAIILHPGADASKIKMAYTKSLSIINKEVHIPTKFGDIVDHAPITFYENNKNSIIASRFTKKGNTVSFALGKYDNTKTVIIDPWPQTPNFATAWDCVWECEKDGAGNIYIIGGVTPMQLIKYNSTGALQWTYNTPYDTSAWLGTFATDNLGNSYVTQGSAAAIVKVNNAGTVVWNNASPGGIFTSTEFWNISFNCDQSKLVIGGTGGFLPPLPYIYDVDVNSGNITASVQVTGGQLFPTQEVRSIAACGNGKFAYLTHDSIGYISQNFSLCPTGSSAAFHTTNSYGLGYKCENWRKDNSGIMAIRYYNGFLYTHKGNQVHKRDFATGAIIATAAIAGGGFGGSQVQNSGLDIDASGNVYVGSGNAIVKYDGNLNVLSSVATTFRVYDVHVISGGDVVACGSTGTSTTTGARTGTVQVVNMTAAAPLSLICCDATICNPGVLCQNATPVTLVVATPGGTFSGPGVNPTTGLFNPATAGVGTHTISYTLACGNESITIVVSPCVALSVCQETNGSLTVSNGVNPYNWQFFTPASSSPITNSAQCTACGGSWTPFVNVCLVNNLPASTCNTPAFWTTFSSTTNSGTLPASFPAQPIQVTDNAGSVITITTLTGIPACSAVVCPTITVTNPAKTNVLCFGQNTGTATASASGSTTAYTYNWMPGSLTGASQTGLAAGTYTVTATDANSCTGTTTITITQPASAVAVSISSSTPASCGSSNGAATANGTGGTGTITYNWMPGSLTGASQSALASGTYTVTATDGNSCTATTTVSISNTGGPTASISSQTNILCFGQSTGAATATATGGTGTITYNWMPGSLTGASQTGLAAGTYTVTATDGGSCAGTTTVTITQPANAVSVSVTGTTPTTCGSSTGTATASATGGTGTITYNWMPGSVSGASISNLTAGTYTVTATDANGCTATATGIVASSGGPTISISSQTNVLCNGGNNGGATASATGGTGTITYNWMPGSVSGASISNLAAGTYTVTATDGTGCSNATTVTITQPAAIVATVSTTPATCGNSDGTATVNATGGNGVLSPTWNTSATTSTITALAAGTYTVTITDVDGCTATSSGTVGVTGNLSGVNAGTDVTIISGTSTQLNGTVPSGATILWTPSTGLSCTTCEDPLASPTQTTIYILTASQNGCTGSDTVIVFVDVICGELFVPTAFSPNEDGQNDFVYVMGNCITNLEFFIYDRWGEKVFETKDAAYGWDGTYRGKKMDAAVFVYYLTAMVNGQEVTKQGNITLIK